MYCWENYFILETMSRGFESLQLRWFINLRQEGGKTQWTIDIHKRTVFKEYLLLVRYLCIFHTLKHPLKGNIMTSFSQQRKLRLREFKWPSQDTTTDHYWISGKSRFVCLRSLYFQLLLKIFSLANPKPTSPA